MHGHFRHTRTIRNCRSFGCVFFIEPGLLDNNVPFNNTNPIYVINLLWKLRLGLGLGLQLHFFAFFMENNENEHLIFLEFHGR